MKEGKPSQMCFPSFILLDNWIPKDLTNQHEYLSSLLYTKESGES